MVLELTILNYDMERPKILKLFQMILIYSVFRITMSRLTYLIFEFLDYLACI